MVALYIFTFFLATSVTYKFWQRLTYNSLVNIPLFIIIIVYQISGETFGFKELNENVYLYFSVFLILGSFIEICMVLLFRGLYNNQMPIKAAVNVPKTFCYLVIFISFLVLFFASLFARQYGLVSEEFEGKMASGFVGHLLVFLMITPPFIYLAYANKKITKSLFFFCVSLVFICLFLKQVKSWIMIPIVYFFVMYLYFNKVNKKKITLYSLCAAITLFMLFFLVYSLKAIIINPESNLLELFSQIYQHFLFYLFSGVGGFSEYLHANTNDLTDNWYVLVLPVVNIINMITAGTMESAINSKIYIINYEIDRGSNVFTIYGTMWMYLKYYAFLFYGFIVALQAFLYISRKNYVACSVFWMITSFGLFSWFDYYYFLLGAYEAPLYILVLAIIFMGKKNEKRMLNSYS
ncbi:DUF6337 family protein [Escherichia coli]|uniref:O-antigen polymerase n=2 Tax=Escherichia coli TaxID=562 RepID=A0A1J1DKS6_ECOLX|nr:DUF6337 family protein [Escherichia coli]BAV90529.1 O-antigen polymerase [Escherichia coli]